MLPGGDADQCNLVEWMAKIGLISNFQGHLQALCNKREVFVPSFLKTQAAVRR